MTAPTSLASEISRAVAALPANVCDGGEVLTVGVDIAQNRVEFEIFAWGLESRLAFKSPSVRVACGDKS
ncbi:phage terminase large subunit family protein [Pseudomonas sp. CCC3.2]|uniref:terminase gpA endonuclease subunit n=1 Tax=unclassified Pseudomonas TaxID=196821 RepID=UPI002AB56187|nr:MULTISPECIES: terminase gpA endonuclease subunit [unclassified Pseudomonas]MDY7560204.1 hypothetical protein [Pseudomonas sp. AB6]MEB0178753.1 phage terminase large subunit family protein [Pseudomonas sp. CCC3.2]MEB0211391.1 phage terminase large subunit family protein [Pseudomonas sp. AB6]